MAEEESYRFVDFSGVDDETKAPRADNGRYRCCTSVFCLPPYSARKRLSAINDESFALLALIATSLGFC